MGVSWIDARVAPGRLEDVRAFVNTRDRMRGPERLRCPGDVAAWLRERGLADDDLRVDDAGLERVVALREALRALLVRNGGGPDAPEASDVLAAAVARGRLTPQVRADGSTAVVADADGLDGALGRLVAAVFEADAAGAWRRLRACADPGCAWAFYDRSRNGSSRWCDMAICGNRAKQRGLQARRRAPG